MKCLFRWVIAKLATRMVNKPRDFSELIDNTLVKHNRIMLTTNTPEEAYVLGAKHAANMAESVLHNQAHAVSQLRWETELLLNEMDRAAEYASDHDATVMQKLLDTYEERMRFLLNAINKDATPQVTFKRR